MKYHNTQGSILVIYGSWSLSTYVSKCFTSLIRYAWEPQQGRGTVARVTSSRAREAELPTQGHQAGLGLSVGPKRNLDPSPRVEAKAQLGQSRASLAVAQGPRLRVELASFPAGKASGAAAEGTQRQTEVPIQSQQDPEHHKSDHILKEVRMFTQTRGESFPKVKDPFGI